MTTYLHRYQRGEFEQVWSELLALEDSVREPRLIDDVMAVAREFARRAWHNSQILYSRLSKIGYRFANPEFALVASNENTIRTVEKIESEVGSIPLSLKAWYEQFDSIDFSQHPDQLASPGNSPVCGLGSHPCLIVQNPQHLLEHWVAYANNYRLDFDSIRNEWLQVLKKEPPLEPKPFLPTGTVASNCESKGFHLPDLRADGLFYDDGGGDTYFVTEIRRTFQWGGFPFCRYFLNGGKKLSWEARPDAERLIPYLQEGLVPL